MVVPPVRPEKGVQEEEEDVRVTSVMESSRLPWQESSADPTPIRPFSPHVTDLVAGFSEGLHEAALAGPLRASEKALGPVSWGL